MKIKDKIFCTTNILSRKIIFYISKYFPVTLHFLRSQVAYVNFSIISFFFFESITTIGSRSFLVVASQNAFGFPRLPLHVFIAVSRLVLAGVLVSNLI